MILPTISSVTGDSDLQQQLPQISPISVKLLACRIVTAHALAAIYIVGPTAESGMCDCFVSCDVRFESGT